MKKVWNWRVWQGHVPSAPSASTRSRWSIRAHREEGLDPAPERRSRRPLMVVDCAEAKHRNNLRKRGWIADISWELARKWK